MIEKLKCQVIEGKLLEKKQIEYLMSLDLGSQAFFKLLKAANEIRQEFLGNQVDLCTIINAKSGLCSEDCKFCAQSVHYNTNTEIYELLPYEKVLEKAKAVEEAGAHRFSLVTSGKGIDPETFKSLLNYYSRLKEDTKLALCASHGIVSKAQLQALKSVGVSKYHHNLETSEDYYSKIVSSHDYKERVETIREAQAVGLEVCSGGILGLDESMNDRIEMILELRRLDIKSIPINVLMPVEGTPMFTNKALEPYDILRTLAVIRFAIPDAMVRYAGGRIALGPYQQLGFESGVNAALVGNFLTTIGSDIKNDIEMVTSAGLELASYTSHE